jgi:hypothetical protein
MKFYSGAEVDESVDQGNSIHLSVFLHAKSGFTKLRGFSAVEQLDYLLVLNQRGLHVLDYCGGRSYKSLQQVQSLLRNPYFELNFILYIVQL